MIYSFNNAKVHYRFIKGDSDRVLVFLHGWGRSGEDFDGFVEYFSDYSILLVDFPPFGKSTFNPQDFTIFSYANMVISLCENLGISSADFIGHSFGGRICLIISVLNSSLVNKCIFVDSAGMKPRRSVAYHAKVLKYKLLRKLGKQAEGGSADYRALSPEMKGLFKNIVNTHLDDFALHVKCPTLIVWGNGDRETPPYMARRMAKKIKGAKLQFLNGGHFAFLEHRLEFCMLANKFLKEN